MPSSYVLMVPRRQKLEFRDHLKKFHNFIQASKWLFIGVMAEQKEVNHHKDINPTSSYLNS